MYEHTSLELGWVDWLKFGTNSSPQGDWRAAAFTTFVLKSKQLWEGDVYPNSYQWRKKIA